MSIAHVIQRIHEAGFHLTVDQGDIIVNPPGKLSPEQRQFIKDHKPEIKAALLEPAPAGADLPTANAEPGKEVPHVALAELPTALVTAARRVCIEVHGDTDEQVQQMVEDLRWSPPSDWPALTEHFEAQLPPAPASAEPARVTCGTCAHAFYREHPALAYCRAGVPCGNPVGAWWVTDRHECGRWEVRP